jgi:hypothetical protein
MKNSQHLSLNIGTKATMYVIAADPKTEITPDNINAFAVEAKDIDMHDFVLPPAAVAAIEIEV